MKSRALICTAQQQFSLEEFDIPRLAPTDVLVRNSYSGVSVGTEFAVFRHKLDYGPFPVCTGYQGLGLFKDTGADVSKFKIGDKVYYRRNFLPMHWAGSLSPSVLARTPLTRSCRRMRKSSRCPPAWTMPPAPFLSCRQ